MLRYLLAVAALASPVAAQPAFEIEVQPEPHTSCVLTAEGHDHLASNVPTADEIDAAVERWYAETNPTSEVVVTQGPSATFVVTYTGFDPYPDAQAAYQSAVDIWAAHIASAVPIRVTAQFAPLGPNVLGSAGPFLIRFNGAPQTGVWYPYGIADAISGTDLVPGAADLQSRFSSNFTNWYFGTDGQPAANQFDFRSVVLHELGHGLGFSGSARWDDGATAGRCDGVSGNGCWGYNGTGGFGVYPQIFDIFAEDAAGLPLLDVTAYPNPSPALGALVRSSNVWINTPLVVQQAGGRGRLWTPTSWQAGSSYSHWNEGVYPAGNINAPMTPQIAPGESFSSPGPLTCAFFGDMGWPLGPACMTIVADEASPAGPASSLRVVGANPFADVTRLRLSLDVPEAVDAGLYDVTGRRVRTLFAGTAPAGPLSLDVRAAGLANGVYTVRATAGAVVSTARVVVAR